LCSLAGIFLGLLLSLVGLLRALFAGSISSVTSSALDLVVYFGGFACAGIVAGLFNPLARSFLGAAALGIVALIPAGMAFSYTENRSVVPPDADWMIATAAVVIIFGICFGLMMWDLFVKPRAGVAPWTD
jgi:hypothetical protein